MKKTGNIVDWILLKRVLKYSHPYRKKLFYAALSAILLAVLGPLRPWLINYAIDNYIIVSNLEMLAKVTLLLFLMLFAEGFFQFYYMFLSTWIGQNVIRDIRTEVFQHIISLKMKYFDNTQVGTLVTRTISDIETISDIFSQGLLVIIAELLKLILVLKGKMSLIGPRPERPEMETLLKEKIPHYDIRNFVKPGISGWAQVNYPYGSSIEDSNNKLSYDLFYISNYSFNYNSFSKILKLIFLLRIIIFLNLINYSIFFEILLF